LQPLGLFRVRASGLQRLGRALQQTDGRVPTSLRDLLELPQLGRYGAHAVRCFAFGRAEPIVDTNVARVLGRYFGVRTLPQLHTDDRTWRLAAKLVQGTTKPRELNWALLDLGATLCRSKNPVCTGCPLRDDCSFARARGL